MTAPKCSQPKRLARCLAAAGLAVASLLVPGGCAKLDVDATGYRKYWQSFVSPSATDGDSRMDERPSRTDPGGGLP